MNRQLQENCIRETCIFFENTTQCCDMHIVQDRPCVLNPNRFEADMLAGNYSRGKTKPVGIYQIHIGKDDVVDIVKRTSVELMPDGSVVQKEYYVGKDGNPIDAPVKTNKVASDKQAIGIEVITTPAGDVISEVVATSSDTGIEIIGARGAEVQFADVDPADDNPEGRMNKKGKATIIK